MKKKILIITLVTAFSIGNVFSQSFKLGLKGGLDFHKLSGKSFKEEFGVGYNIGAFATIGLTSRFGIQPELLFSQVNIDTANNFSQIDSNFNKVSQIQLKYLSIPLIFNFTPIKYITFQVGPQYGILIDQNKNLLKNGDDAFKKGDFSVLGGVQVNIKNFKINGRYIIGLTDINALQNKQEWKNQRIQIGVGITLL